jgi:predicted metal-dependent hydrolase
MRNKKLADLEYSLVRSASRRTGDIVVERDGNVTVRAPAHIGEDVIERAVSKRAAWVHRTLAEWDELNSSRRQRQLVEGASVPYLGRNYRIHICSEGNGSLEFRNGRWQLSQLLAKDRAAVRKAFRDFYILKGGVLLGQRVQEFASRVGVKPGRVAVKELGYRWASCGARGTLNFHWKIMMAPHTTIDYLVVHELCHLRHRDHSNAFWNEVDKVLPNYRERKEWLRQNGASFDLLDNVDG